MNDMPPHPDVLVIAELSPEGTPRSATGAAVALAHQIAGFVGGQVDILAFGADLDAAVQALRGVGAREVLQIQDATLSAPTAERLIPTLAEVARGYAVVVGAATVQGRDLLPRLAARLDAAYASDCLGIEEDAQRLTLRRPIFAGNVVERFEPALPRLCVTARQSAFEPVEQGAPQSEVRNVALAPPAAAASRVEVLGIERVRNDRPELADAKVVVAGGRALGAQFFDLLGPLADELGAALGATRAACDGDHAPGDFQIGQTGKIVAPDLYIAVGISGAIQHVAGIRGARTIVAINRDPEAPIFEVADYGLVGDLFELIPELTAALASGDRAAAG